MAPSHLVFVYNVDASPVAMLRDLYAGLTTGTTDCHLCDLTYGRLMKDRSWSRFVEDLPCDVDFQMRSTFMSAHPELADVAFPATFLIEANGSLREVLSAEEIDGAADLDALRSMVTDLVAELGLEGS